MKCLVLAGGKGDRLWPLSRKDYPKQFIKIQKNHSIFQETIARNMAFCDEFIIVTNKEYELIIEDQMKVFQGITYRTIYEEIGRKTTAAIILSCLQFPLSETMFVVASDHLISGDGYKENILQAKELAKHGGLVTFGMHIEEAETRFGYLRYKGDDILDFVEKPDLEKAIYYKMSGDYYINSGMFLFQIGNLFHELEKYSPWVYSSCKASFYMREIKGRNTYYSGAVLEGIEALPIEKALFEQTEKGKVVQATFQWKDVASLEDIELTDIEWSGIENQISYQCENTKILNRCPRRLVVANELKDIVIINTKDAVYVGKYGASDSIKSIMSEHEEFQKYFQKGRVVYRPWGNYELMKDEIGYQLRRVEINEGKTIYSHIHEKRSENWSIIQGEAKIILDGIEQFVNVGDTISVKQGISHQISNIGKGLLVFIEVSIGEILAGNDMVSVESRDLTEKELGYDIEPFIKMQPVYKDYLWGGNKLRKVYGKYCDYDMIAESWELSAHKAGESIVATGRYKGRLFGDYLQIIGKESLGWKCKSLEEFPILIKFIDAKEDLSVQVHPEDNYALEYENEYGKNEMWYIIDAEDEAGIYYGFKRDTTISEVRKHLQTGTILDLLNWIPVNKGETYFIPAGTIHAIGKGVVVCEIQQSSNSTYRLYDYARKDQFGNYRELHLDKGLEVLNYQQCIAEKDENKFLSSASVISSLQASGITGFKYAVETIQKEAYTSHVLSRCKYFECVKYDVRTSVALELDDSSFYSIMCIAGDGQIILHEDKLSFQAGDSIFIPKREDIFHVNGNCEIIVTHI
ncbi:MAG: type I phosphomannose isomerase catalytic subunit [Eubacteriales bacterium]